MSTQNNVPAVTIIACGGAGINVATQYVAANPATPVRVIRLDLSDTNLVAADAVAPDTYIFGDRRGAGADRAYALTVAREGVSRLSDSDLGLNPDGGIVILLGSMAGGSGSVIAPVVLRTIAQRDKDSRQRLAYFAVMAPTDAVRSAHCVNTLATMQQQAASNGVYLPTSVVYQTLTSREQADMALVAQLRRFIAVMTTPTGELDFRDRMNALSPHRMVRTNPPPAGIAPLAILVDGAAQMDGVMAQGGLLIPSVESGRFDVAIAIGALNDRGYAEHHPAYAGLSGRITFSTDGHWLSGAGMPATLLLMGGGMEVFNAAIADTEQAQSQAAAAAATRTSLKVAPTQSVDTGDGFFV